IHYRQSAGEARQTALDCDTAAGRAGSARVFHADLTRETDARALLPAAAAHFGRVDAVVNNASLFEHDDAASFGYTAMHAHMAGNTGAAIVLAQALAEHLRTAGDGRDGAVVNLLDQKLWNLNPDFLSY